MVGRGCVTEIEPVIPVLPARVVPGRRDDENPYWVYLARFSGETERVMRTCLDQIAAMLTQQPPDTDNYGGRLSWEFVRYPHVLRLRNQLAESCPSLSYANLHMSAIRGILRECWRLGLMSAEDFQRARDVENVKGSRELAGRDIPPEEIAALLAACLADDDERRGIRDAALVAVLQSTGIRRAEAAAALIERYNHGERSLKVIGKGNKERTVYIHPGAVPYLGRWLVTLAQRRGPIFRRIDRWGNISDRPLTARTIGYIVNERCAQAKVPQLTTHDFRRNFIGDFIDAGGDLVQAQKLAGHASATTTAAYDRRPGRALRTAVDRLSLPSPDQLTQEKKETGE
jgi:site-specific recombinase XerD